MYLRRTAAIVLRYFYLLRGNPARWLPLFAWVAIDIVLWGYMTRYLNSITSSRLNFIPSLLGAVLLFDFFTRVMHGVAGVFLEDVWSRNFLNLFASPLTISQYLLGLVITSTVTSLLGLIVMLVLAMTVFGLPFFSYGLILIPFLLILHFPRDHRLRRGAPVWPGLGMVRLAHPRAGFAFCRCLLPAGDAAALDAGDREPAATRLCLQGITSGGRRRPCLGSLPLVGRRPGHSGSAPRLLVFQARL